MYTVCTVLVPTILVSWDQDVVCCNFIKESGKIDFTESDC
jgi:hypothetical protein